MKQRKPTLDDYVNAIVERDSGIPYPEVLQSHKITPNRFFKAVNRNIVEFILYTEGDIRKTLEEISLDDVRKREMFNMGDEFIQKQYDRVMGKIHGETQSHFYEGTLVHPDNIQSLVYYALTSDKPQLASTKRGEVIEGIKNLPRDLKNYFRGIRLYGLMNHALKDKEGSPLAVLEVFDIAYQRKTGDKSLFDLSQKEHLHKWGNNFQVPRSYWQNPANVEEAVYHMLTENNTELASKKREDVIQGIKNLPSNLQDYFHSIELAGLMNHGFEEGKKNSPLAVLEVFDTVYQRIAGDKSLFDLSQEKHLHRWGDNFKAPNSYWQNPANVEEAVYHMLTENNPELASKKREEVIQGIKNLPSNLQDYFYSIELHGLMLKAFEKGKKDSPLAVLEVFDKVYMETINDASLFDKMQNYHLKVYGKNRIIRQFAA